MWFAHSYWTGCVSSTTILLLLSMFLYPTSWLVHNHLRLGFSHQNSSFLPTISLSLLSVSKTKTTSLSFAYPSTIKFYLLFSLCPFNSTSKLLPGCFLNVSFSEFSKYYTKTKLLNEVILNSFYYLGIYKWNKPYYLMEWLK